MDDDQTPFRSGPRDDDCLTGEEARQCIEAIWADRTTLKRLLAFTGKLRSDWRIHWMSAEDILHEVATKLIETRYSWPRYMSQIPSAFVIRKIYELCREQRRTPSRNGKLEEEYLQELSAEKNAMSSEEVLTWKDTIRDRFENAGLSEIERNVLWLRLLGFSNKEITQQTGIHHDTVRSSVRAYQRKIERRVQWLADNGGTNVQ